MRNANPLPCSRMIQDEPAQASSCGESQASPQNGSETAGLDLWNQRNDRPVEEPECLGRWQGAGKEPREDRRGETRGYVYFIQAGGNVGAVKIGWTRRSPLRRLADLQGANHLELELVCAVKADSAERLERQLHNLLGVYHIRGEWFRWHHDIGRVLVRLSNWRNPDGTTSIPDIRYAAGGDREAIPPLCQNLPLECLRGSPG